MLKRLCTALWTASAPLAAAADGVANGVYDSAGENCSNDMSETRITLADKVLTFYESSCTIDAQQPQPGGGQQLKLTCSGEGEAWQAEMVLTATDQGLTLQSGDQILSYQACR